MNTIERALKVSPSSIKRGRRAVFALALISILIIIICASILSLQKDLASKVPTLSCLLTSGNLCPSKPISSRRNLTEWEAASASITQSILRTERRRCPNAKVALLFLTKGRMPLELVWDRFLKVFWGDISVVDAERRLLAWALLDPLNEFFVLLSEAYVSQPRPLKQKCMPIRGFQYMYDFLMRAEHSFVESYYDDGPHGVGRYLDGMMPEVPRSNFRKGSQMMDPGGIANYSVTFVDWTQGGTHPRLFDKRDLTPGKIKRIQGLDRLSDTLTPIAKVRHKGQWCYWNGEQRPCFLFMRKVHADVVDAVMELPEDILGY
eukprot:jgi/Mesen1/4362/ME000022S03654